jgi:hypothetical protein
MFPSSHDTNKTDHTSLFPTTHDHVKPNQSLFPSTHDSKPSTYSSLFPKEEAKNDDYVRKVSPPKDTHYNIPKHEEKPKSVDKRNFSLKNSMLANDYQHDKNNAAYKKLDIKLPCKLKSVDYFKLLDSVKKILDHGTRELSSNKVDKALDHAMLALYYLHNIEI